MYEVTLRETTKYRDKLKRWSIGLETDYVARYLGVTAVKMEVSLGGDFDGRRIRSYVLATCR